MAQSRPFFNERNLKEKGDTDKTYSEAIVIIIAEVHSLRKRRSHFTRAQKLTKPPATQSIFDKRG